MKLTNDQLIVITGGAGFIGSNVIQTLNDQGITNIVIFDNLGKEDKWKNLVGKRFLDIFPKEEIFSWLIGKEHIIEGILHLGACTSTVERDANYLLENNYRFSTSLAEYAIEHGIRFVYASSAATYGNGENGFADSHEDLEGLRPLNMYGFSKHLFDLWLKNQGLLDKVAGLKYFNVFGPNEAHKGRMASVVHHMAPVARREGKVKLFQSSEKDKYKDGDQLRDFVYVKDVAKMTAAFLASDATGIYNIGSGRASTWNELVSHLFNALDLPLKIDYIPMPEDLLGKYQNFSEADMKKTRQAIGKAADPTPLKDAIHDYVKEYLLKEKLR